MTSSITMTEPSDDSVRALRMSIQNLSQEIDKTRIRKKDCSLRQVALDVIPIPTNSLKFGVHKLLKGHADKVANICWDSNGDELYSVGQDGLMIKWCPVTGFKKSYSTLRNPWVLTSAISLDLKLFALAGLDNVCTIYQIAHHPQLQGVSGQGNPIRAVFAGHSAYISDCAFNTNHTILTGSGDMTLALWDVTKGGKTRNFVDHLGDVLCLSLVTDRNDNSGNIFVSGAADGYCKIWDCRQQNPVQNFFSIGGKDINCLKMFPDSNSFAAGSEDGVVRLYDLRSDVELEAYSLLNEIRQLASKNVVKINSEVGSTIRGMAAKSESSKSSLASTFATTGLTSLDFSILGRLLFACYEDIGCIVWDTMRAEVVGTLGDLAGNSSNIQKAKVSPDGLAVATSLWDSNIRVWTL